MVQKIVIIDAKELNYLFTTERDPSMRTKILIADDHDVVRNGMRGWLERESDLEVVCEAVNGLDALEFARSAKPDVILMDIHMPKMTGIEVAKTLRSEGADTRIIIMTGYEKNRVKQVLDSGANGYLSKEEKREVLIEAVRWAARREDGVWISPSALYLMMQIERELREADLSKTEMQVLSMIDLDNSEIRAKLRLSDGTLRNHLSNIYFKLKVDKRNDAVQRASSFGLLQQHGNE